MKMKSFGVTETKLFHFHRIFKNGGGVGEGAGRGFKKVGLSKPLNPIWIRHWIDPGSTEQGLLNCSG